MFLKWQYFSIVHITSTAYSIRVTSGEIHYKAKSNPATWAPSKDSESRDTSLGNQGNPSHSE